MSTLEVHSGNRIVRIVQFWARGTYAGIFEGEPAIIDRVIRSTLKNRVVKMASIGEPIVVIEPPAEGRLPAYLCAAYLESNAPPIGKAGDVSFMTLAWLTDMVNVSVLGMVTGALRGVSWDEHAGVAFWTDYV